MDTAYNITSVTEQGPALEACRQLFAAYQQELGVDLCFQGFAKELENPLEKYGPPRGILLLAEKDGEAAGCIALQPLAETGVCEMKRLYVPPPFRKDGIGRALVEALLQQAPQLGYTRMKLDTLAHLQPAIKLYHAYGFTDITAYYHNPLPEVVYMEKTL